jgi:DNA-binding IclR family transcriptional regulator
LLAELRKVRQRRYAVADQETFLGIKAAGVGFASPRDGGSFAISISYPKAGISRQDERRIVEVLLQRAERLGGMLGDPWWTGAAARPGHR